MFNTSSSEIALCEDTYLRPDRGGALIPWLYALFLLLFHLPACIIRAVRWESAQYLALVLAILSISLTVLSYQSTHLRAAEVLVWMPLALILDVGAMLQMAVLIVEKHGIQNLGVALRNTIPGIKPPAYSSRQEIPSVSQAEEQKDATFPTKSPALAAHSGSISNYEASVHPSSRGDSEARPKRPNDDILKHAVVALFAFIFLLILIGLQLAGLVLAVQGRRQKGLTVKWCAPAFRDFAKAITTGDCQAYEIGPSSSNGIGCIDVPARHQEDWLTGTIICLSASIAFQVIDMVLLRCAHGKKFRGVKMQRPWLTMFGGVLILVMLIAYGVFNANRLPPGVTNTVWIYRKEPCEMLGRVCQGNLKSPGLRGMIIGWSDGLFDSWGSVYHGSRLSHAAPLSSCY
ncbi:hypothetical protein K469DRAFT_649992 [Zopfia rhizophila CBS 207.26]|uniref:Uncharacterized protein n=1 Tax=Zopfia rhizophila CBS 207.26 TaxID=1314779 RepID=A0A6A6F0A2_9PEZI|nr:hypothetical protein K469DRAFT_649992 [Zopfia rhizophila CBS 207.26]